MKGMWGDGMELDFFDREEYRKFPLLKMKDNNHGDLLFYIRRYDCRGVTVQTHRHQYMQINYVSQGKGRHRINNQEFEITRGDIFVIPPYIPHCIVVPEDSHIQIIEFEFEPAFINQNFTSMENAETFMDFAYIEPFLVAEHKIKPRLNLVGRVQVEVEDLLNEALQEYTARNSGFVLLVKSLLLKLLVIAGREFTRILKDSDAYPAFTYHKEAVLAALKYIGEHYAEEMSVEEVAKRFVLSQSYFSFLFKNITSRTFIEYLNGLRISKAMEMLRNTEKRVLDISLETGFNSVNHFNRIFKQYTGLTPLEYRKSPKA